MDQNSWTHTTGRPGYISLDVGKLVLRLCRHQWLLQLLLLPSPLLLVSKCSILLQQAWTYLHDLCWQIDAASAVLALMFCPIFVRAAAVEHRHNKMIAFRDLDTAPRKP